MNYFSSLFTPLSMASTKDYILEAIVTLIHIRDRRCTGRLAIRGYNRQGVVHFYFQEARLIHIVGNRRDLEALLNDLLGWSRAMVRFDSGVFAPFEDISWQQAELFTRWLGLLEMHGESYGVPLTILDGLTKSLSAHLPLRPLVDISLPESDLQTSGLWKIVRTDLLVNLPEDNERDTQTALTRVLPRVGDAMAQAVRFSQGVARRLLGRKAESTERADQQMA